MVLNKRVIWQAKSTKEFSLIVEIPDKDVTIFGIVDGSFWVCFDFVRGETTLSGITVYNEGGSVEWNPKELEFLWKMWKTWTNEFHSWGKKQTVSDFWICVFYQKESLLRK